MRVALISEQASPLITTGPAARQARHVAELATTLADLGHDVRVYTRAQEPHLAGTEQLAPQVTVEHVAAGPATEITDTDLLHHTRLFGEHLAATWQDDGWAPDLIHAHYWLSGLAAMVAGRAGPAPIALTYHEVGASRRRFLGTGDASPRCRIGLERELGRTVDRVITQSEAETMELVRLGVPRHKITLIPTGIDPACFSPTGDKQSGLPERRRIVAVGSAGVIQDRKGFTDLIQALQLIPDAEMVVIGGPREADLPRDPQARKLRAVAAQCGVSDRVRFVGAVPREEMPRWYRSADLLACPSWYEPFGIAAVEGMASGVPVVATSVGAFPDAVIDGLTGVVVPPHQPVSLGRAIRGVLANPIRSMAYASAGVDRARQCYSWQRVAGRIVAEYQQLRPAAR